MRKRRKTKAEKAVEVLNKSPINYFSDLFVIVMVLAWAIAILVMLLVGVFASEEVSNAAIWSSIDNMVTSPLSAGGALWMIKNGINHAIAGTQGKVAEKDFPNVEVEEPPVG